MSTRSGMSFQINTRHVGKSIDIEYFIDNKFRSASPVGVNDITSKQDIPIPLEFWEILTMIPRSERN